MRAAIVLVWAACSVPPVSVEGKACPCPSGYACVAQRCTQIVGAADATAASDSPSTTPDAPTGPLFDDEFNAMSIAPVWDLDVGSWGESAGMMFQTVGSGGTLAWVTGFETQTDYQVTVAATAQGNAPTNDDAMEIAVRVGTDLNHTHYQCSWEPGDKTLRVFDVPRTHTNDIDGSPSLQMLDPFGTYVLHADVSGKTIHCYVEGVSTADLTLQLTDAQLAAGLERGTFGLATYDHGVAFDYIRVTR